VLVRALLVLFFVMAAVFAWRSRRLLPGMAALAAVFAAAIAVVLLRHPVLIAVGIGVSFVLILYLSRPKKPQ
jgi:hypothetical protein